MAESAVPGVHQQEEAARGMNRNERRRQLYRESRQYIPPEDIPFFVKDPLREEELDWTDIRGCRLCGLKAKHLPNHLIAEHRDELSGGLVGASSEALLEEYRRRFGYNKNASLICEDLRAANSKALKKRNSRRRQAGRPAIGHKARFRKGRSPTAAGTLARKQWGTSAQTRLKMSRSHRRRALPALRKKSLTGQTVTDWQIAKLRLEGKEYSDIAKKVNPPLTRLAIRARLQKIGFPPGKPCRFFRGEPVTEKQLRSHYEDLKLIRMSRAILFRAELQLGDGQDSQLTVSQIAKLLDTPESWIYEHMRERSKDQIPHSRSASGVPIFNSGELLTWALGRRNGKSGFLTTREIEKQLAQRLGVGVRRVYEFIAHAEGPVSPRNRKMHRKPGHPLSWDLAGGLLSSIASLREEFRRLGTTAKGGRPKALLPSEEKELPGKYQALKSDLHLVLTWAERQDDTITLDILGEGMCQQSRLGKLQVLLLWPSLHAHVPAMCESARNRLRGGLGAAERAKELLCEEYAISPAALDRAIASKVAA